MTRISILLFKGYVSYDKRDQAIGKSSVLKGFEALALNLSSGVSMKMTWALYQIRMKSN
ncbi:TPA: hypothetical protein TUU01_001608 [Streptococcus equi subsp. zooepidemicus]|nr:hypothetical protein [Streptococcus equi subsp. equi]HEL0549696.1 hypothetical protein [Streptococcus equi subsp. zooepidemicus]HEK9398461.1 hypothetical protein [Streptococcus equi subsp. equi]HEK9433477.1 hypothetical protein [Streptococcus equi subsp. equi]HEK9522923.1 hypothetical protein [Streptococcus equi subsp. equi]